MTVFITAKYTGECPYTKGADVRDWIYDRVRRRKISAVCGRAPRLDRPGMPSVGDVTPACLSAPSDCIGQV